MQTSAQKNKNNDESNAKIVALTQKISQSQRRS